MIPHILIGVVGTLFVEMLTLIVISVIKYENGKKGDDK